MELNAIKTIRLCVAIQHFGLSSVPIVVSDVRLLLRVIHGWLSDFGSSGVSCRLSFGGEIFESDVNRAVVVKDHLIDK